MLQENLIDAAVRSVNGQDGLSEKEREQWRTIVRYALPGLGNWLDNNVPLTSHHVALLSIQVMNALIYSLLDVDLTIRRVQRKEARRALCAIYEPGVLDEDEATQRTRSQLSERLRVVSNRTARHELGRVAGADGVLSEEQYVQLFDAKESIITMAREGTLTLPRILEEQPLLLFPVPRK